jgi:hypothetical protein
MVDFTSYHGLRFEGLNHNLISIIGTILSRDYFISSYRTVEIYAQFL